MPVFTFLLPFVVLSRGLDYSQADRYGKSEAQVLAMGQDGWDAYYESRGGNSTAAMVQMNAIFGEAAEHRNQRLEARVSARLRREAEDLRKLLGDYGNAAANAGSELDGGGTMWAVVGAQIEPDTEAVLFALLGGKMPKARPMVVSEVVKQLDGLAGQIASDAKDKSDNPTFDVVVAKQALAAMRRSFARICGTAKRLKRTDSDRVLGFCREYARSAAGDWG